MKDACHHLKHTQKKVIQSVRKEQAQTLAAPANNVAYGKINGYSSKTASKPSYGTA